MTPDGKVMMGLPPDPRAAQWRIAVMRSGIKMLWTEMYTESVLQEYESCAPVADAYGRTYDKCSDIVGHIPDPDAGVMGWTIELNGHPGARHLGIYSEEDVILRASNSMKLLYISPLTKEALACGEERRQGCPGDTGTWRFEPPLQERVDITLDSPPGELPGNLTSYYTICFMALALLCCLGCMGKKSQNSLLRTLMIEPLKIFARAFGIKLSATINR